MRLIYKGWSIQAGEKIVVYPTTRNYLAEVSQWRDEQNTIIRDVLMTLQREFENDPFGLTRASVRDPRPLLEALRTVTEPL